jgi:hypothetical protein
MLSEKFKKFNTKLEQNAQTQYEKLAKQDDIKLSVRSS